jgi:hypothetical protein
MFLVQTRQVGLEPTTSRLTAGCSTIELLPKISGHGRPVGYSIGVKMSVKEWVNRCDLNTFSRDVNRQDARNAKEIPEGVGSRAGLDWLAVSR